MASVMEAMNASSTRFPNAIHATISTPQSGLMSKMLDNVSVFSVFLTLFAVAIVYDQSECRRQQCACSLH